MDHVLSNSFGFGGTNVTLAFSRVAQVGRLASEQTFPCLRTLVSVRCSGFVRK